MKRAPRWWRSIYSTPEWMNPEWLKLKYPTPPGSRAPHWWRLPAPWRKPKPVIIRDESFRRVVVDVRSPEFLYTDAWLDLRQKILATFGAQCQSCGRCAKDGVLICVDHIRPRSLFPELALDESNLQVLCGPCNRAKGNWDQTDWRRR